MHKHLQVGVCAQCIGERHKHSVASLRKGRLDAEHCPRKHAYSKIVIQGLQRKNNYDVVAGCSAKAH